MNQTATPAMAPEVAATFDTYPATIRTELLSVRQLIFDTAAATDGVGPLTETLKWGEPAYLTASSKSGSTIRLGWARPTPERYAVYFNCKTDLIETFRTMFAEELTFEGNRAILLSALEPIPKGPLTACLAMGLTYHRGKRRG